MSKYSNYNAINPWNTWAENTKAVKKLDERDERDCLAQARRTSRIRVTRLTIKILFLFGVVAACCFLFINYTEHIMIWITQPLLPTWCQAHIDTLRGWVIATTSDKFSFWIFATPIFFASWRIVRWIDDDEMTLLEYVWFLAKVALVIAIFAAMLYGALIIAALAALAFCVPLVAEGMVRPGINRRWRY